MASSSWDTFGSTTTTKSKGKAVKAGPAPKQAASAPDDWASFGGGAPAAHGGGGGIGGAIKHGLGAVLGSAPVRNVLDVVDTPRAAVTSLVKEGIDLAQGDGFSVHDLVKQTKDNYGFGQLLEEEAGSLPINVKRALGFVGDVGLDPLTYLTLGASAVEKAGVEGVEAGTRLTVKQVADRAASLGEHDLADRVMLERGTASLTAAERTRIGVSAKARWMGKEIPHSEVISRLRQAVTNPVFDKIADSKVARAVAKETDPMVKTMAVLRRERPAIARSIEQAERTSRGLGDGLKTSALKDLTDLHKVIGEGLDNQLVGRMMEDGTERAAAAGSREAAAATDLADWFEKAAVAAEKISGRDIPRLPDYLPHQLTAEFKAVLDEAGQDGGRRTAGEAFERTRQHRIGSEWFGEELKKGTLDEMEEIAQRHLGDNYVQVFQNDPWALAQSYANSIGRMAGDHRFMKELEAKGLVGQFDEEALKKAVKSEKSFRQGAARRRAAAHVNDLRSGANLGKAEALAKGAVKDVPEDALVAEQFAKDAAGAADQADTKVVDLLNEGMDLTDSVQGERPVVDGAPLADRQAALAKADAEHEAVVASTNAEASAAADVAPKSSAKRTKLVAEISAREEKIAALGEERIAVTRKAAAAVASAPDADSILRKMAESPEAAVEALTTHGDPGLARIGHALADDLDELKQLVAEGVKRTDPDRKGLEASIRAKVTSARSAVADLDEAGRKAELHAVKDIGISAKVLQGGDDTVAFGAAKKTARLATDADTAKAVYDIDKQVKQLTKEIEARKGKLSDLADNEVAPTAITPDTSKVVEAAKSKVAKLTKAVDEGQIEFDAQRSAGEGWDAHVAAATQRLTEIDAELKVASKAKAAHLADEKAWLRESERMVNAAAREQDATLAKVAKLESVAAAQNAKAVRQRASAAAFESIIKKMDVPKRVAEFERMLQDGMKSGLRGDPTLWADPDVAKVVKELAEKSTPAEVGKFLKSYDALLGRWKAYSLLSPGFHVRNYMGGQWNNWMAGVEGKTQRDFVKVMHTYWRAEAGHELEAVAAKHGDQWARVFTEAERLNVWGGHNLRDFADIGSSSRSGVARRVTDKLGIEGGELIDKLDPTSMNFAATTFNMTVGEKVEKTLRGPLFADRIFKGFTPEQALDDVIHYHFDYSELSKLEKTHIKRLIPFYTWTRKNFPLQLENMVRNPGKLNRYNAVARNLALGVDKPDAEPGYYGDLLAMLTPFKTNGGDPVYAVPDLPFTRIGEPINDQLINGLTPALKAPIEVATNHSFFTGTPLMYQGEKPTKIPGTWAALGPVLKQLDGVLGMPKVTQDAKGNYLMDRKEAYKIESTLPLLGRLRRLFPNEPKYQDRALTTYLSTLGGVGSRTLTPTEIQNELKRRRSQK